MRKLVWLVVVTACGGSSRPPATKPKVVATKPEVEEPKEAGIIGGGDGADPLAPDQLPGKGSGGGPGGPGGDGDGDSKTAAPKRAAMGTATTSGDLDKAIIRRYIKRSLDKITACYEQELAKHPGIAGTLNVQFTIEANGTVSNTTASGVAGIEACVAKIVRDIQFPNPKGGGTVKVTYPFMFRPDGT